MQKKTSLGTILCGSPGATIPVVFGGFTRAEVVAEARSWFDTPYHLKGRVKGVCCDCFTFIAEVNIACGLMVREELGFYSHDWFQHTTEEHYMYLMMRHAAKLMEGAACHTAKTEPGNIVLSRVRGSKVYNHGGIVTQWPRVLQSVDPTVNEVDITTDSLWCPQQIVIFDPFRKPL
jgi:cell wall-associated NlpC family hydrolase